MAANVPLPRFAPAGNAPSSETWNDIDHFDVEMLAEYLLDDGASTTGGMKFDFNFDGGLGSAMVSPENSEDGNLPFIAETSTATAHPGAPAAAPLPQPTLLGTGASLAPAQPPAATTFPNLPAQVPTRRVSADAAAGRLVHHHHHHLGDNDAKRQRLDQGPMVAVAGVQGGAGAMLSKQQLAVAAATAMQQGRGRKKTQAQIDRRRERNRILARRTRLRKKFFFESLQKEVMDLQRENEMLKNIVKNNVQGEEGKKILDGCTASENLPPSVLEACGEHTNDLDSKDFNLVQSIQKSQNAFVITDPSLQDNPIVFASDDFLKLTGYTREQVLGRNCRFLQGTDTKPQDVEKVRKAIATGEDVSITIKNYTADGTPFWNQLFIAALRDAQNNVVNYIGVIVKVAGPVAEEEEAKTGKEAAEDTVKAIECAVAAAVAAASGSN